ncbi:type III polyketide synthase [Virgibacillus pantothenticus]|uniref:type III polyketide synthase n=1 Tax=Virgibacillus pantothenticus TaxID=1473 RepID=UPI0009847536|nr:3-oxoacyl-[acyl-carrier-protein] synthase III C-terminal domain-containing protein [Virgibacillus pantothenticus]
MSYICSVGLGIPDYHLSQQYIKQMVQQIFTFSEREINRLLPVFDHAQIEQRQFAVSPDWFLEEHSFQERNDLYLKLAKEFALKAVDDCLLQDNFLSQPIAYQDIDMIIFVSSTGVATPSLDAHLINERPFRQDVQRMPLWGLGCAGGAIGLARANDWLTANPEKCALVICCELCSLTFQKGDLKKSNLIGTALFGDGISAALLVGEQSSLVQRRQNAVPRLLHSYSYTKKGSLSVMGWQITDAGFEVIFSKSIPALVENFWQEHIQLFFEQHHLAANDISAFIAHPGGKKVIEAMQKVLQVDVKKFQHSTAILKSHGNMSSATVLYVLRSWMKEATYTKEKSVLSALGPGFSSELILMEWMH